MGEIFTRATCIFASFGMRVDDIQILLEDHQTLCTAIREASNQILSNGVRISSLEPFVTAYENLGRRAYFQRVWIVQELVLASKIKLLCGAYVIDWDDVKALGYYLLRRSCKFSKVGLELRRPLMGPRDVHRTDLSNLQEIYLNYVLSACGSWTGKRHGYNLGGILSKFWRWQYSDPRDHIYGFLSILNESQCIKIDPDYQRSCIDLATECLGYLKSNEFRGRIDLTETLLVTLRLHSQNAKICEATKRCRINFCQALSEELMQRHSASSLAEQVDLGTSLKFNAERERWKYYIWKVKVARIDPGESGSLSCALNLTVNHDENEIKQCYLMAVELASELCFEFHRHVDTGDFIPKLLTAGARTIGMLCARARPGDFLCLLESGLHDSHRALRPYLVIRPYLGAFAIIGQALLSTNITQRPGRRDLPHEKFSSYIDRTDLIIYLAQDLVPWGFEGATDVGNSQLQLQRLFTGITREPFPSYAVAEKGSGHR